MRRSLFGNRKKKSKQKENEFDLDTMFEELEIDVGNC